MDINMRIKTDRLIIRPIVFSDWYSMKKIWEDFNASEYVIYDNKKITEEENLKKRIAKWAEANQTGVDHMFFAFCLKSNAAHSRVMDFSEGEMIGFASFHIRKEGYEIGYCFLSQYQGLGYASEGFGALIDCIKKYGAKKLYAGTGLPNTPSVKLLKKLGFQLVGTEQVSFFKDEKGEDLVFEGGIFELDL